MTQIKDLNDGEILMITELAAMEQEEAVRQSYDLSLMLTELSEHDLSHMQEIIREGYGDWFKARLLRALDGLLIYADPNNVRKLRTAFPGTCAAYMAWYNGRVPKE